MHIPEGQLHARKRGVADRVLLLKLAQVWLCRVCISVELVWLMQNTLYAIAYLAGLCHPCFVICHCFDPQDLCLLGQKHVFEFHDLCDVLQLLCR
jgi:hypothetical protein